jgi:hypothetical protein
MTSKSDVFRMHRASEIEVKQPTYPQPVARKGRRSRLSKPIYWEGRQWAVTRYGIERLDGTYPIDKNQVFKAGLTPGAPMHGLVAHMAQKQGVDVADFACALEYAMNIWREGTRARKARAAKQPAPEVN